MKLTKLNQKGATLPLQLENGHWVKSIKGVWKKETPEEPTYEDVKDA